MTIMYISIILLSSILFHQCQAAYPTQKCLICSGKDCESAKPQVCPADIDDPNSGTKFVDIAFGESNATRTVSTNFGQYVKSINLNESVTTWEKLTRYVCYTSQNDTRGCLVMGKGLCAADKSWLGKVTGMADKVTNIMGQTAKSVTSMFSGDKITADISKENKTLISKWIATNYFARLVNNSASVDGKLDSCCERDGCNFSPIIKQSKLIIWFSLIGFLIVAV